MLKSKEFGSKVQLIEPYLEDGERRGRNNERNKEMTRDKEMVQSIEPSRVLIKRVEDAWRSNLLVQLIEPIKY